MMRLERVKQRAEQLVASFEHFLVEFDQHTPFTRPGQLECHLRTIRRRREFGGVEAAVGDTAFVRSLWDTLRAWGIGSRASRLAPLDLFHQAIVSKLPHLKNLESLSIDSPDLNTEATATEIWLLIDRLGIVENDATLVPCTKALHHLLPDLIVPMDRAYTRRFFAWDIPEFQYQQKKVFIEAFRYFAAIARDVSPGRHVGAGWRTSRTKILDNALVGYCLEKGLGGPSRRERLSYLRHDQ